MVIARHVVAVAGTNAMKIGGTQRALDALRSEIFGELADVLVRGTKITGCPVAPPQPFGFRQTRLGAKWRADKALIADAEATLGVGLENGVMLLEDDAPGLGGVDIPVACIVHRDGRLTYGTGPGVPVEGRYILASLASGQQVTCGRLIADATGFDHANWHRSYLGELSDREEALAAAVFFALAAHLQGR